MSTDDEPIDEGRARRMMRDAILRELQSPAGEDEPPPVNKLQQVVRALIAKAAREDVAAIKEILDRVDGKAAGAGAEEGSKETKRQVDVRWKEPTSS